MADQTLPVWLKKKIEKKAKQDAFKEFVKQLEEKGVEVPEVSSFLSKNGRLLAYIGGVFLGFMPAVMAIILNFLIFVWLLHLEF